MEMFPVLHLTGSTYHNLSVLQGPVLLLKIFTYATEQSQKNSLNKDTGITNFAKPSPTSIIEIFLSLVNTKCNLKTLLRQGISHPKFYGDVIYKLRKILMYILKIFFTNVSNPYLKKNIWSSYIATHFTFGYRSLYNR